MQFPRERDKLTALELQKLSHALGMPRDILIKCLNCRDKILITTIIDLLRSKQINQALHKTYNMYNAEYNINVILKALEYLSSKTMSFNEINEVRYVFEVYEADDLEGIPNCDHIISRVLKLCGRAIAPLKLQHQLKKMREYVDVVGRLQLYEFLEIIPLTTLIKNVALTHKLEDPTSRDYQQLYKLDNFTDLFIVEDEKIRQQLQKDYQVVLSRTFDVKYSFNRKGRPKMIYNEEQLAREEDDRTKFSEIKNVLRASNMKVKLSRNSRHVQDLESPVQGPSDTTLASDGPHDPLSEGRALSVSPLVSPDDMHRHKNLMKSLEWDIINNEEKYMQVMRKRLTDIKNRKKFRENRNMFAIHPPSRPSTFRIGTVPRSSRPSTIHDLFTESDEDATPRTLSTQNVTSMTELVDGATLFEQRKKLIMEKIQMVKEGKRLIDI